MTAPMTVTVRFAPSPTGLLHVGNVRVALLNWLFARQQGGRFMLRIDDTDTERSRAEYETAIRADLSWLGLDWDLEARQSARMERYNTVRDELIARGLLYPCYETPEELELKRKSLLGQGRPPVYDRAALRLSDADRAAFEAEGRRPHWRFKLGDTTVQWDDLIRGPQRFEPGHLSDPVLIRADGQYLYTLCSVVDDADFAISHVVRGEDHVANTAVQMELFAAIGASAPQFAHYTLLSDTGGGKLSKRAGSLSVQGLRDEQGVEPLAINAYLGRIGTSDPIEPVAALDPLVAGFDFGKFARNMPKFDDAELTRLNARILQATPYAAVAERLQAMAPVDEGFWAVVRPNIKRLGDVASWWAVAHGPVSPVIEDAAYIALALERLPAEPWNADTWGVWTKALSAETGRKGKQLFMPLRQALTGMGQGPEMAPLLPLIGRVRAAARLRGEVGQAP